MNTSSRFTFLLLFILSPTWAFGQAHQSIDFVGGIDYNYRVLRGQENTGVLLDFREEERPLIKWRTGFNYNKRLGKKTFLKTGFRLAKLGYKLPDFEGLRFGVQHDGMGGFLEDTTGFAVVNFTPPSPSYYFIEIPLMIRLEIGEARLSSYLETGLSGAIYAGIGGIKNATSISGDPLNSNDFIPQNFNHVQVVANFAFGLNFSLTSDFQLFSQSIFRYHLTKLVDASLAEHLLSVGLELGLRRKF